MAATLRPDEEKLYAGQPRGFPLGDFDIADVMLPEGDDMDIPSDDEESFKEEDIQTESGFGNVVVVDNLPQAPSEKVPKLTQILAKIFGGSGRLRPDGLFHPVDASGASKGYAFVEYETQDAARAALAALNGYQLDKAHTFVATSFDDFERYGRAPDAYTEPEPRAFEATEDVRSWLSDRRGRDQFVARFGDETEVYWNDVARQQPEAVYQRSFWTDSFVVWSPRGSLLATLHQQGVAVWAGASFKRLGRVSHPGVQRLLFSPDERYLLTFSELPPPGPRDSPHFVAHVWEVRTGRRLRTFDGPQSEYAVGAAARPDGGMGWPAFRWAGGAGPDGAQYLAHMKRGSLAVYEAPDMHMLDKKSIKLDSLEMFEWSPSDPVAAVYQGEHGNLPARVALLRMPGKEELRAKNLFSVAGVRIAWHPQGDYLAVQVDKFTKTKKSTTSNFEIFSLREKDVPIDMLELPNKMEKVGGLAWEPRGARFAVLHGEGARPSVSFYTMRDAKAPAARGVAHLTTLPNKQTTSLHWSPAGRFVVLAGLTGGHNGVLEFWDVEESALMAAGEHFMASEVEWDPTGRYVATVSPQNSMEAGFHLWSFAGQPLYKVTRDRFFQLSWRPRPATLLSEEAQREIARNLKRYTKRYEEEDEALLMQADSEFIAERERMMDDWRRWADGRASWAAQQASGVRALLGSRFRDESEVMTQEVEVSVVVDTKEEPAKLV